MNYLNCSASNCLRYFVPQTIFEIILNSYVCSDKYYSVYSPHIRAFNFQANLKLALPILIKTQTIYLNTQECNSISYVLNAQERYSYFSLLVVLMQAREIFWEFCFSEGQSLVLFDNRMLEFGNSSTEISLEKIGLVNGIIFKKLAEDPCSQNWHRTPPYALRRQVRIFECSYMRCGLSLYQHLP